MSKISIIIPCYNQGEYLKQCVESCLAQTWENIEIILVDDGSTDRTSEEMERLSRTDTRIREFRLEANHGGCFARNYGLSKAIGDFIYFLDADDFLHDPDVLNTLIKLFPAGVDFIFADKVDLNQKTLSKKYGDQSLPNYGDPILNILDKCPRTGTFLFRKIFFDRMAWDESLSLCQEFDLLIRGVIGGMRYAYFPRPIAVIRHHRSPTRLAVVHASLYGSKIAELVVSFESLLKEVGKWDYGKELYFNYRYCKISMDFYYGGSAEKNKLADQYWKRVKKKLLIRRQGFRWMSWFGVCFFTNALMAACLGRFRDKTFRLLHPHAIKKC